MLLMNSEPYAALTITVSVKYQISDDTISVVIAFYITSSIKMF